MSSVSVQGLSLSAACPSGVVVGMNTEFGGTITYSLVNSGDTLRLEPWSTETEVAPKGSRGGSGRSACLQANR